MRCRVCRADRRRPRCWSSRDERLVKAVLAIVALAAALPAEGAARFAVVAGNNHGATGRARLWFAEGDADRFARALRELGDFSDDRVAVLRGKGAGDVRAALASMEQRIRASRATGEDRKSVV